MVYYFAYGSNISEYRMKTERDIKFKSRKFAVLENYKLVFNKVSKNNCYLGFANVIESPGDFVEGALYEINDFDLMKIDKKEGYPIHYYRQNIDVLCGDSKISAVVYVANSEMIRENIKPDKKYLSYILDGKDLFSTNYYDKLLETKTLD
jgi:gamma-glutamylcyclotransferase (GGCT)/AIG2-like uncharacterized protein YtfP